ncbi:cytochrome c553 [Amaricoccus macauensis]|uniref:Cytochrome c553 n=1 Tax=Amaricoccus macauensis TaxID=57001 RepID=A0A840SN82_9RHOB|nr:c-type cytochrome [Amaricoccus macauensis]MBB5220772.1 cytochrome c553 [Amaricoccus macauensis]
MRTRIGIALCLGAQLLAGAAMAQDAGAGRKIANMCRTCHGLDGIAAIPVAPNIGGEPASYLAAQLRAFRSGERQQEMMSVVAASLSDQQIADVTAWYASQKVVAVPPAGFDPAGAPEACAACHGADGIAVIPEAPNLAGENTIYIDTQLKAFRTEKRRSDVMGPIAAPLDDAAIRAAAEWYASIGLRPASP